MARYCANCGDRRQHEHPESDRDRDNYCKGCRNNAACRVAFCKWCGERGCTRHGSSMTTVARLSSTDRSSTDSLASDNEEEDVEIDDDMEKEDSDVEDDGESNEAYSDEDNEPRYESRISPYHDRRGSEEKCPYCLVWFKSKAAYDAHQKTNNSGCSAHEECFPSSEEYDHAKDKRHSQCFVPGCKSKFAEGSWDDPAIERHIWDAHTRKGR